MKSSHWIRPPRIDQLRCAHQALERLGVSWSHRKNINIWTEVWNFISILFLSESIKATKITSDVLDSSPMPSVVRRVFCVLILYIEMIKRIGLCAIIDIIFFVEHSLIKSFVFNVRWKHNEEMCEIAISDVAMSITWWYFQSSEKSMEFACDRCDSSVKLTHTRAASVAHQTKRCNLLIQFNPVMTWCLP